MSDMLLCAKLYFETLMINSAIIRNSTKLANEGETELSY